MAWHPTRPSVSPSMAVGGASARPEPHPRTRGSRLLGYTPDRTAHPTGALVYMSAQGDARADSAHQVEVVVPDRHRLHVERIASSAWKRPGVINMRSGVMPSSPRRITK